MADANTTAGSTPSLRLGSTKSTRQTLARIIRAYGKGTLEEGLYKGLVYGLSHYLAYLRFESDMRIEERIDELEKRLNV